LKKYCKLALALLILLSAMNNSVYASESVTMPIGHITSWRELRPSPLFKQQDGLGLYQFKTENGSDANLIVLDLNAKDFSIKPFFNHSEANASEAAARLHALVAVNGGYFNLSNGESTSHVVIDQINQCDPKANKALIGNAKLAPYLPDIFRRSEVRFLKGANGERATTIAYHGDPIPKGWELVDSLQAGPRLLPTLTAKEEAFVRTDPDGKEVDSIGSRRPAARTAFGITSDNHILIICVAGKDRSEFAAGINLTDLASLLKRLGSVEAINFDGGTSTTMVVNEELVIPDGMTESPTRYREICGATPERFIKSGLSIVGNQ
jgi:Phosphodiester glycosidase